MNNKILRWINIFLMVLIAAVLYETVFNLLARSALIQSDFNKAAQYLSMIRNKELLGFVYYKQDRFEEAYNFYRQQNNWRGIGWAFYGLGKYDEAQDCFKKVNDHVGIAQVKLVQGNLKEAREIFNKTSEYSGIGLTDLAEKRYSQAKKAFIKAKDSLGLGLTYYVKGDFSAVRSVFLNPKNRLEQAMLYLTEKDFNNTEKVLKKVGDAHLLGTFYQAAGLLDTASEYYSVNNNNPRKAYFVYLSKGEYLKAYELLQQNGDANFSALLYKSLGDYEKVFEAYKKVNGQEDLISLSMEIGNYNQALKIIREQIQLHPDQMEWVQRLMIVLYRMQEYKELETVLNRYANEPELKVISGLLRINLDELKGKTDNLIGQLQSLIEDSGAGFLADDLYNAAVIRKLSCKKPPSETIEIMKGKNTKTSLIWIMSFFLLGIGIVLIRWLTVKKTEKAPEMEDIRVTHGEVPRAHKQIYSAKTSLNMQTVSKIQPKTPAPAVTARVNTPTPFTEAKRSRLEKSGVQILQMALKRLGIVSTAFELMELSGENSETLTVYGIYLAARAKGAQVQGIKVDLSYLKESSSGIHIVFFNDESFALLNSFKEELIDLSTGVDEVIQLSTEDFKQKWNGYVISLSKF